MPLLTITAAPVGVAAVVIGATAAGRGSKPGRRLRAAGGVGCGLAAAGLFFAGFGPPGW